jgi:GT2 family glycosyltransferase
VVVPTHARETRLSFALEALAAQTLEPESFEVLVVRPDDDAESPLAGMPPRLTARSLVSAAVGAAAQRNVGWRAARAPLVAFTDDDCRPAPDWLERLLAALDDEPRVLQGRTEPDPEELHLLHGLARSMEVTEPNPWYPTCNIAYPRELLERVGGFDERFPGSWGEDTDLALRALEGGAAVEFVDDALVWHAVHPRPLPSAWREAARHRAIPVVLARHPAQRSQLYWGFFLRKRHAKLLLAIGGLAMLRRRPLLAALAVLPYAEEWFDRSHGGARGLVRQAMHLPARASVDAVETIATVRAAIRNRVLVV